MNARRGDEVYACALAALAGDDAVTGPIGLGSGAWTRTFARYTPGPDPIGTIAFQRDGSAADIVVVAVHAAPPADPAAVALPGPHRAGWLLARRFPDDPRLPGLAAVMAGPGRRTVVRYRPGRRCTIRVEDGSATRFVKVLKARADGARMHRDAVALAAAAAAGRLGFAVAAPDRFDPATCALWQSALPGAPVKPRLLGPEGPALAESMGAAIATLHASGVEPSGLAPPRAAFARARSATVDLSRRLPALRGEAEAVLARIEAVRDRAPERPLRPLHGAAHAGQWLADGDRLALVDFDRFGLGDPESDVAVFTSEMAYEDRAPGGIGARFVAGYEASGARLDPVLLAGYLAAGHLAAARRMARGRRPGAADRAARAVARAAAELDAAPAR